MSQVLPLVVNLAMTPWIIHGLGPARYSVFLLISAIVMFIGQLDGGISRSSLRFFTLYAGRDDRITTTRLLISASVALIGATLVMCALVLPFTDEMLRFFRVSDDLFPEARLIVFVTVPFTAFLLVRNLYSSVVLARQRFAVMAMAKLVGYAVYMTGTVITVIMGWGLYGIAAALVAQGLALGVVSVPAGLRYLDRRGVGFVSRGEFIEFASYAWRVQVTSLVSFFTSQKDQLAAGRLLSAQASGPFGQGTSFATQLSFMPQNALAPIQALTGQRVGRMGAEAAAPAIDDVQRMWVKAVTGWSVVGAPAAYFGVQAWLPDSYAQAGIVSALLIFGNLFWLMTIVSVTWALTLGHSGIEMRGHLIELVANVLFSLALFPVFGMIGVVLGTTLGRVVLAAVVTWETRRRLPVRLRWFGRDVPILAAVIGFAASVGMGELVSPFLPRGALGLLGAGISAILPMLLFFALAFRPSELKAGWRLLRSR